MPRPASPRSFTRRAVLAVALAASTLFAAAPAGARSIEDIRKSGTLVVASEGKFAPFNFVEGGKLAGFELKGSSSEYVVVRGADGKLEGHKSKAE